MFVQFSVENFLSFKDEAMISMLASKRRSKSKLLDENSTFDALPDIKLLKTAVIYGANGSGKSNIFKAIRFMKNLTINSSKESQAEEEIEITPFLASTKTPNKPSRFEMIFISNETLFQYEFSVSRKRIEHEKLTAKFKSSEKEKVLFERTQDKISVKAPFPEGKGLEKRTRDNALFLSVCANFDGEISGDIIRWFKSIRVIGGLTDQAMISFTRRQLENSNESAKIRDLLNSFDLGISNFKASDSKQQEGKESALVENLRSFVEQKIGQKISFDIGRISTEHKVFDENGKAAGLIEFDLEKNESEGTKKLVALSGPLIDVLENSLILFIDEFDARLHPVISKQLISIFNNSPKNNNNAQLIVASHDTNLLDKDLLRRDQIWFTEKDIYGSSHLNSLLEYRVRNDASFEKDYISGKYGAIPLLGDSCMIFSESEHEE
ncbi:AAA family ATPase [Pseudomonas aeruginosa]|uniref:AAA family ATPase n=1 Tax=Pseudomonas aeruginosa TaxID=287 RepID=UPI00214837A3|nr:ATP-binding protein [Pseudomonas aeruginosa]MCQ9821799.1 ATP-binding protein [Pseudomonas aeruginosa]